MHLKYCQHVVQLSSLFELTIQGLTSACLVLTGVWAHLSIHYSQYLHFFYPLFSVKVTTVEFYLCTLFPGIQLSEPMASNVLNTTKRWKKSCCCRVLLYDLASKSGFMSLMPCSAATVMMWSRAFRWPNSFTTSLIWSLLADMGYI